MYRNSLDCFRMNYNKKDDIGAVQVADTFALFDFISLERKGNKTTFSDHIKFYRLTFKPIHKKKQPVQWLWKPNNDCN
jgi:hypothetical protein